MRSVLLSINAVLVLFFAFAAVLYVPTAHAQSAAPGGVICSVSGPSFDCGTAQIPSGVSCQWLNSQYYCYDSGGQVGVNCDYDSTGSLNCTNSGSSNNVGGSGSGGNISGGAGNAPNGSNSVTGGGWLDKLTGWIANAIHSVFQAVVSLLKDMLVAAFAALLALVVLIVQAIPVPDFLKNFSMASILGGAGPIVGFFMSELNIGIALGMIGAGYAFRLLRKFLTLFQW